MGAVCLSSLCMWRPLLLLVFLSVVFAASTLNYNQLVSGMTKFQYTDSSRTRTVVFVGFTIRENIVCEDGPGKFLVFERPNLRYHGPYEPRFAAWYNLTLVEASLGIPYMLNPDNTYDMSVPTNKRIYGADARIIECRKDPDQCIKSGLTMPQVTGSLILRGGMKENFNAGEQAVMTSDLLTRLSNESSRYFPVGVVGGCVRDFLANDIAGINDIDAAIAQEYLQIAYRLKDIFVDWNQPIDDSVLDQRGIRKEFGLLKIRPQEFPEPPVSCAARIDFANENCYADGLDIGPFKGHFEMSRLKTYVGSGRRLQEEERTNHYVYAYSYAMDSTTRDFTINTVYYDYLGDVYIDPTGKGKSDSDDYILRISDPLTSCDSDGCPWRKDLGGWFRYWRFIGEPEYEDNIGTLWELDGKKYNLPDNGAQITIDHVCHNLNKAMCRILQSKEGKDEFLHYNAYSFFLKLRKKRKFTSSNQQALLFSWRDDLINRGCPETWTLLTELAASSQTKTWTHLLEGSPETDLVLKIIGTLASSATNSSLDYCQEITSVAKSAQAPLVPVVSKSLSSVSSNMVKNFECFMQQYILSDNSYSKSELIWSPVDDSSSVPVETLTLDEYEYYYASGFDESSVPVAVNPYPRWTDLEIVVASELSRPVYVHKLILLFVYPHVSRLSPSSDLSRFVQAMQDGDQQTLSQTELTVSDISYTTLVKELDRVYGEDQWKDLLHAMSDWRYRVASQEEIAMTQWNSLGGSRIVTAESGVYVPVSRFFLASFCHEDGVQEMDLLSRTRDLFWEVGNQRLAKGEDIERALDLISWDISAAPSADAQQLVGMAKAGDFFCDYQYEEIEFSSSTSDTTSQNSLISLFTTFIMFILMAI